MTKSNLEKIRNIRGTVRKIKKGAKLLKKTMKTAKTAGKAAKNIGKAGVKYAKKHPIKAAAGAFGASLFLPNLGQAYVASQPIRHKKQYEKSFDKHEKGIIASGGAGAFPWALHEGVKSGLKDMDAISKWNTNKQKSPATKKVDFD